MKSNSESVFKSPEGKKAILNVYDSILGRWPVRLEQFSVKTRAGDIFVLACGDKELPPLILLHGSGSNSAMWIGDVSEYIKKYRVYAIDLPGEPGKSSDLRPDLTTTASSDWLYDVFNGLNIDTAIMVGISLGGWLAVKFLTAYPERASRLVLLCPSGIGPQKLSFIFKALFFKLLGDKGEVMLIKKVMGVTDISDETIEFSRLISKNFNPYMGIVPVFSDGELKRLIMPILLIVGAKDVMLNTAETASRIKKILPHAQTVILPTAGHGLIDQKFRIMQFLNGDASCKA